MKRPSFLSGVCAAAVLAFLASVGLAVLTPIVPLAAIFKLLVPVMGLAYIVYLLSQSPKRVGRATALAAWGVMAASAWIIEPPLVLYLLLHVSAVWLIRSLYFYSSMISALGDLGLNVLGVAAAFWAAAHSGSPFLAVWCFFLVQALFVAIPAGLNHRHHHRSETHQDNENFEQARAKAEAALRQLLAQSGKTTSFRGHNYEN